MILEILFVITLQSTTDTLPTKVDSTWCPVIVHTKQCRFRLGPWQPKGREYVRFRYCSNIHKIKQIQRRTKRGAKGGK
jgi:hypothetical protein